MLHSWLDFLPVPLFDCGVVLYWLTIKQNVNERALQAKDFQGYSIVSINENMLYFSCGGMN